MNKYQGAARFLLQRMRVETRPGESGAMMACEDLLEGIASGLLVVSRGEDETSQADIEGLRKSIKDIDSATQG
ncbi:MAG: hypothetical protein AAGC77_06465 [Pseudomonadota bacterium]